MKKTSFVLFFMAFRCLQPYAQSYDPYSDLAGAYFYPSVKTPLVTLELFTDGQYIFYQHKNKYSGDLIEIEYDWSTGYYLVTDSLLTCYSDSNESIITVQFIDSLNMKVIHSEKKLIKNNDFIYRIAAYFPIDSTQRGSPFGDGYYSKWYISYNYPGLCERYYRSSPKKTLIMFDYDDVEYLSDKIYKFKGIQDEK